MVKLANLDSLKQKASGTQHKVKELNHVNLDPAVQTLDNAVRRYL